MSRLPMIVQVYVLALAIPAAIFDLRQRRVPNWLTLPALLIAIALNVALYKTAGFTLSLAGLFLALLIYFPLYALRAMGAGDVKLMAAIGAAVGWANCVAIFFITAVTGGIAGLIAVVSRGRIRKTLYNLWFIVLSLAHRQLPHESNPELDVTSETGLRLPHAVAIACGVAGFLLATAIWSPKPK